MPRLFQILSFLTVSALLAIGIQRTANARQDHKTKLPADLLAYHQKYPDCAPLSDPMMPPVGTTFSAQLDKNTRLYGILCEPSPYNLPYAIYLVRGRDAKGAERLNFADYERSSGWAGTNLLYNAYFDKKTGTLNGFSKGRGLGDCGSQNTLQWDGNQFSLMEYRYKEECDGKVDKPFPLIYKRTVGVK